MPDEVLSQLISQQNGFAVYPEVRILQEPGGRSIQHLIFGDFITPPKTSSGNYSQWTENSVQLLNGQEWLKVRSRQVEGWIRLKEIQSERVLEINFIDVGQGDGCHLVTPTDEHFIIDAGEKDNMYRFLRWRFNLASAGKQLPKFQAVISHPDDDHYGGFTALLASPPPNQKRAIKFDAIFHNGIIQQSGNTLGEKETVDGEAFLTSVFATDSSVRAHLQLATKKSKYEKLLDGAITNMPAVQFHFTHTQAGEKKTIYSDSLLTLEIIAPIPRKEAGRFMLPWFDTGTNIGKTKNGHSVVVMARIRNLRVFLGGDLNAQSSDYLLSEYSGINVPELRKKLKRTPGDPDLKAQMEEMISKAALHLRADVAKACHHGSHDITNEFLKALSPIATVISSGDEESFCHPRPETLGAIGKYSRGERPLLYSTELARSSPEYIEILKKNILTDKIKQKVVATYGMITLRSDGLRLIMGQKLEKATEVFGVIRKWQLEKLIWDEEQQDFIPDN